MNAGSREQEGIVRFTAHHQPGPAPEHPDLARLGMARDTLFTRGLIGVSPEGIGYGNVSLRDGNTFVVSGTGTGGLAHLEPEHWCRVLHCEPEHNRLVSCGPVAASSESLTHGAVYAADAHVSCVVHVHSATLFAQLMQAGAPCTPAEVTYGTPAMAAAVMDIVRQQAACGQHAGVLVMTGHPDGVLAWGSEIETVCSYAAIQTEQNV